ncbi:MAG: molybdopterin molybdotransferase MoeA [Candidatus Omnitrophica bacterium]|nr:molybdopterin molybdotransferase MoeA [Candidatus Omnitrophota bacterium]
MISVEEAQKIILENTKPSSPKRIPLMDSLGLILAEDVYANTDLPPFTSSAMDGFAIRSTDTKIASSSSPLSLKLIEDLPAGTIPKKVLIPGTCTRIMTGALLPKGADAVVMAEETEVEGREVRMRRPVAFAENIRLQGEDVKKGKLVLSKGTVVTPQAIGLLAALGFDRVCAFPKARVAILSTGDELIPISRRLSRGKIRDSNSYTLEALLKKENAEVIRLGIAKDSLDSLRGKIKKGLRSDLFLVAGGVSVGTHDLVKTIFREMGVKELFWKVRIKPGKPIFFGKKGGTLVFGLPGNPASSFVSFEIFVRLVLRKKMGESNPLSPFQKAVLTQDLSHQEGRVDFIRAIAEKDNGALEVRSSGVQGSHCLSSLARCNALIRLDEGVSRVPKGKEVEVLFL